MKEFQKKVQRWGKEWSRTPSKFYYLFVLVVVICYAGLFLQSGFKEKETVVKETPLYEVMKINQTELEVVDRRLHPEKRLFEMDFLVSKQPFDWSINYSFDVEVRVKSDPYKTLNAKLNKISDSYYVLLVEDIPQEFEAISVTITEQNKQEEENRTNSFLSIYTVENEELYDADLEVLEKKSYEIKAIDQFILREEQEIEEINQQIKDLEEENVLYEKEAKKVKEKMTYETENEQQESQSELENLVKKLQENENKKEQYESEITEHEEKIELLEKQKEDIL